MGPDLPGCHVILPAPYDRAEWLELRNSGIGGSDAAAVMGLSPWRSAYEVYLEKRGESTSDLGEPGPESPLYWGNALEDDVADAFELTTGLRCEPSPGLLASNDHPYLFANVDRLVYDGDELVGLLEAKTTGLHMSHEWEGEQLPTPALLQAHHYLMVTGLGRAWVAGLIAGQRFVCTELEPDAALHKAMWEADAGFWGLVKEGIPPAPDGSASAAAAVRRRWPEATEDDGVVLGPAEWNSVVRIRDLTAAIKALDLEKEALQQGLQLKLADAPVGIYDDNVVVRWTNVVTNRLNSKALKADHPELVEKYSEPSLARRFTIPKEKS